MFKSPTMFASPTTLSAFAGDEVPMPRRLLELSQDMFPSEVTLVPFEKRRSPEVMGNESVPIEARVELMSVEFRSRVKMPIHLFVDEPSVQATSRAGV